MNEIVQLKAENNALKVEVKRLEELEAAVYSYRGASRAMRTTKPIDYKLLKKTIKLRREMFEHLLLL